MDRTARDDCSGSGFVSILDRIRSDNEELRVESAREIRKLAKTSSRNRRLLADAVEPLVSMLQSESEESNEAAILALLNLAVKDERPDYIEEEITKVEEGVYDGEATEESGFFSVTAISLVQKLVAEAIGTFFVIFAGCGAVAVNKMYGSVSFPGICITWGLIVMVMVYSVGHISGAHFNPAVTVTFVILRRFPLRQMPLYVTAQLLGAIMGSGTLFLLLSPKAEHFYGTTPVGTTMQSFVLEIIISFLLMFVISGVSTDTRAIGELAGIAVGSTILLNVFVAGPISGASMNPARSLGPAIVMHNYKAIWAYIFGPLIGTLAGGFTYNLIRFTDKPVREITRSGSFLNSMSKKNNDE